MKIPNVKLSDASKSTVKQIINASKKSTSIEEQMVMANYYGYLYSKAKTDARDFAKLLLAK